MLPSNLFTHSFQERNLGFLFAALLAILVYIGTLGAGAHLALDKIATGWNHQLHTRLTVEVPHQSSNTESSQEERVQKVTEALQAMPEIAKIARMEEDKKAKLLKPWITDEAFLKSLPLPVLIDVELAQDKTLDASTLKTKLTAFAPDVQVESHAEWLDRLLRLVGGFTLLAKITIALSLFALMLVMSLVCHAMVAFQRETLALLKLLGSTDGELSKHFQTHAQFLAWPAAGLGAGAAAATMLGTSLLLQRFLGVSAFSGLDWMGFVLCIGGTPLIAILLTLLTSRLVVFRLLRRLP